MNAVMERPITEKNITQNTFGKRQVFRGEIYYADISGVEGSVQGGVRPCLIVSNNVGNKFSPVVIVVPISSVTTKKKLPTHVTVDGENTGLRTKSIALLEQVRVLDKWCLMDKIGEIDSVTMREIDRSLAISVGLGHLLN